MHVYVGCNDMLPSQWSHCLCGAEERDDDPLTGGDRRGFSFSFSNSVRFKKVIIKSSHFWLLYPSYFHIIFISVTQTGGRIFDIHLLANLIIV